MIKFRTEVDLPEFNKKMGYRHQTLMIGSCFAENIGNYLQDLCFPIAINPFGILYNPVSIANSLNLLINGKEFTEKDLFYSNGLYHSFCHHSRFSDSNPKEALKKINNKAAEAKDVLKNCSHLFITFGTSWVFEHKLTGTVVSNCHKLPSATFSRYRLSVAQISEIWIPLIEQLLIINPGLHIVFTVSPIRHLKDGAHENHLSKSTLLLSIDNLMSQYGNELISYFPSYELVLDELRDYRFFASDMTHPSEIAIDFVREKFLSSILDPEAKIISVELKRIIQALRHNPLNSNDKEYLLFIEKQIEKANQLKNKFPFIDISDVIKKFDEKKRD